MTDETVQFNTKFLGILEKSYEFHYTGGGQIFDQPIYEFYWKPHPGFAFLESSSKLILNSCSFQEDGLSGKKRRDLRGK